MKKDDYIENLKCRMDVDIPARLLECLSMQELFLFVGSGLSIPFGYPSWENLLRQISSEVFKDFGSKDQKNIKWLDKQFSVNPIEAATLLKFKSPDSYDKVLTNIFKRPIKTTPSILHSLIALLPFKGVVTTNYDSLIEEYYSVFKSKSPGVYSHLDIMNKSVRIDSPGNNIFKIHGCGSKDPTQLVLSEEDYIPLFSNSNYYHFLRTLILDKPLLTIGYSLKDENFKRCLYERIESKNNPPIFSFMPEDEISQWKIDEYKSKHNLFIIPYSPENNHIELHAMLFQLFFYCYNGHSEVMLNDLVNSINYRLYSTGSFKFEKEISLSNRQSELINKVKSILSVFEDPISIPQLKSICEELNIHISEVIMRSSFLIDGENINVRNKVAPGEEDQQIVTRFIFQKINGNKILDDSNRNLTLEQKRICKQYAETIERLLKYESTWTLLNNTEYFKVFQSIIEFYKQEGKWMALGRLLRNAFDYYQVNKSVHDEIVRTQFWLAFHTRNLDAADKIIQRFPKILSGKTLKYDYMKLSSINSVIDLLESQVELKSEEQFLLGKLYARHWLTVKSREILVKARDLIKGSITFIKPSDYVEKSVRYWYLSVIELDLGNRDSAKLYRNNVIREDQNRSLRIPGIAWLNLSEWLFEKRINPMLEDANKVLKEKVVAMFEELGMESIDEFITSDYYY